MLNYNITRDPDRLILASKEEILWASGLAEDLRLDMVANTLRNIGLTATDITDLIEGVPPRKLAGRILIRKGDIVSLLEVVDRLFLKVGRSRREGVWNLFRTLRKIAMNSVNGEDFRDRRGDVFVTHKTIRKKRGRYTRTNSETYNKFYYKNESR